MKSGDYTKLYQDSVYLMKHIIHLHELQGEPQVQSVIEADFPNFVWVLSHPCTLEFYAP